MFFNAEDAEDAEKGFILGKGAVPMQAIKAVTQRAAKEVTRNHSRDTQAKTWNLG